MHGSRFLRARSTAKKFSDLYPVITPGGSDSSSLDNAVEFLYQSGRSLPHVMAMLIPEAWSGNPDMDEDKRAFYEYHASLMEPWDGPAAIAFTDGKVIGATLDRNGLRPGRYIVTKDDLVVLASEAGVIEVPAEDILKKGRLQPGRMFLVDTVQQRIVSDAEIKKQLAARQPYADWLKQQQVTIDSLPEPARVIAFNPETLLRRQRACGYSEEDLRILLAPMAAKGEEPVGSMGTDVPLACLSDRPQPLFNYFKQLFAQVTNPPIDPIREELVMSLISYIGTERNILDEAPENCHTLRMPHPILTNRDLEKLRRVSSGDLLATTLPALFRASDGEKGLRHALDDLSARASHAVDSGYTLLIISDRGVDATYAPVPSLLAMAAVHNRLVKELKRTQVALIIESGEPREVMHFALLIGYGASAINPYLAIETIHDLKRRGLLPDDISAEKGEKNFIKAIEKGLLKTFSKMGISTLQSYRGAQVFEAVGLSHSLIQNYFPGTASRIEGVDLEVLAREAQMKHAYAFQPLTDSETDLVVGGQYQYREGGEFHLLNPHTISKVQHAVRTNNPATFQEYTDFIDDQNRNLCTLARPASSSNTLTTPLPIEEVEPAKEIVKRFTTGAMSFGSISKEAHETLAIAMNRLGGMSNTGEGGEDEARFKPDAQRRLCAAAPSSRSPAAASASPPTTSSTPTSCRSKWRRAQSPARAASFPATKSTTSSPRFATPSPASASSRRRRITTSTRSKISRSSSTTSRTSTRRRASPSSSSLKSASAPSPPASPKLTPTSCSSPATPAAPALRRSVPSSTPACPGNSASPKPSRSCCSTICAAASACRPTASCRPAATSSSPPCSALKNSASPQCPSFQWAAS